jgi:hypothetical protein
MAHGYFVAVSNSLRDEEVDAVLQDIIDTLQVILSILVG